eukprot:scaffold2763_cov88-Skeletonema_dohrnii-CCMP3373.AAC.7
MKNDKVCLSLPGKRRTDLCNFQSAFWHLREQQDTHPVFRHSIREFATRIEAKPHLFVASFTSTTFSNNRGCVFERIVWRARCLVALTLLIKDFRRQSLVVWRKIKHDPSSRATWKG